MKATGVPTGVSLKVKSSAGRNGAVDAVEAEEDTAGGLATVFANRGANQGVESLRDAGQGKATNGGGRRIFPQWRRMATVRKGARSTEQGKVSG